MEILDVKKTVLTKELAEEFLELGDCFDCHVEWVTLHRVT